jgi:hypothetical protein
VTVMEPVTLKLESSVSSHKLSLTRIVRDGQSSFRFNRFFLAWIASSVPRLGSYTNY